jgi:hypothetical protein
MNKVTGGNRPKPNGPIRNPRAVNNNNLSDSEVRRNAKRLIKELESKNDSGLAEGTKKLAAHELHYDNINKKFAQPVIDSNTREKAKPSPEKDLKTTTRELRAQYTKLFDAQKNLNKLKMNRTLSRRKPGAIEELKTLISQAEEKVLTAKANYNTTKDEHVKLMDQINVKQFLKDVNLLKTNKDKNKHKKLKAFIASLNDKLTMDKIKILIDGTGNKKTNETLLKIYNEILHPPQSE